MSGLSISTREMYQVLAAVVAKTGPIELFEREIEHAPPLTIETTDEGRACLLSVRGWCRADACPSDVCGGPHATHVCGDGSTVTALPGTKCPQCGAELAP